MSWLSSLFSRKPAPAQSLWTGRVYAASDFAAQLGSLWPMADDTYAEVWASALPEHYRWFRAEMDRLGVKSDLARQDCDNHAHLFRDFLNLRWYLAQFERGSTPKAQSAAVAAYWFRLYRPTYFGAPVEWASGHAIAAVGTDQGIVFIEPQTGELLTLNDNEIASRFNVIT